jgi:hypothetical protein
LTGGLLAGDIAKSIPIIASDVALEENVRIFQPDLVNLYGCVIGDNVSIGAFVEMGFIFRGRRPSTGGPGAFQTKRRKISAFGRHVWTLEQRKLAAPCL